jgi:hypothetical protein
MKGGKSAEFRQIGVIRSALKSRGKAPKQGAEGAPYAWLEVSSSAAQGLDGLPVGHDIIVVTWLHCARRNVLKVHPTIESAPSADSRRDLLTGQIRWAFNRVTVRRVVKNRLRIGRSHRRYARY